MSAATEKAFRHMGEIETIIEDDRWSDMEPAAEQLAIRCHQIAVERVPELGGGVALLLASDGRMQSLNAQFRDQDKPTNVLSFPSGEAAPDFLGDIALGYETCKLEAKASELPLADHAAHLIVHGLLHLVGYDHQSDEDARVMEPLETEILAGMGIEDPYRAAS